MIDLNGLLRPYSELNLANVVPCRHGSFSLEGQNRNISKLLNIPLKKNEKCSLETLYC